MDRQFDYLHELYRIIYLRAEAQAKKAKEEKEKEDAEKKKNKPPSGIVLPPGYRNNKPTDVNNNPPPSMSPIEAEALEDALEELTEGGMM